MGERIVNRLERETPLVRAAWPITVAPGWRSDARPAQHIAERTAKQRLFRGNGLHQRRCVGEVGAHLLMALITRCRPAVGLANHVSFLRPPKREGVIERQRSPEV